MSESRSTHIVVRLIAQAMVAHIAFSWPLWYSGGGRTFPLLPVFGPAQAPTASLWDTVQLGICLLTLFVAGVFPAKKYTAWLVLAVLIWMIAQDLNRLQPWSYFYLLVLGIVAVAGSDGRLATRGLQWLLAAVYAWGGFNKITPYFAEDNFPWFCEAFTWTQPLGAYPALGYAVALAELLLAPGLLWGKSRPVFRWLAIGFHAFIILALSPLGLDWNLVVIPWNVAMAGMVWVLFSNSGDATDSTPRFRVSAVKRLRDLAPLLLGTARSLRASALTSLATRAILALAWVFPALNILHLWDEPLSWKMYSNTQTEAGFFLDSGSICPEVQPEWEKYAYDAGSKLLFDDWAFDNLHVPAYNSPGTHQRLAQYLCPCANNSGSSGLHRLTVQRWNRSAERWEKISCTTLIR